MDANKHRASLAWRSLRWAVVAAVFAVVGMAPPASAAPTLNLWGPDSITSTGNYTYTASFLVPYADFQWATRNCTTATVESCTTTWNFAVGSYRDQFSETLTRYLTYTCPPGTAAAKTQSATLIPTPTYTFQVRVIGSGFGQPPQTKYKVTNLCGTGPL